MAVYFCAFATFTSNLPLLFAPLHFLMLLWRVCGVANSRKKGDNKNQVFRRYAPNRAFRRLANGIPQWNRWRHCFFWRFVVRVPKKLVCFVSACVHCASFSTQQKIYSRSHKQTHICQTMNERVGGGGQIYYPHGIYFCHIVNRKAYTTHYMELKTCISRKWSGVRNESKTGASHRVQKSQQTTERGDKSCHI